MNFNLTIKNGTAFEIVSESLLPVVIPSGQQGSGEIAVNTVIPIDGMGDVLIIDVSDQTIWDFPIKGKFGVLVRYQGTEAYYRFDTDGNLTMDFSFAGDFTLSTTSGQVIEIKLPGIAVESSVPEIVQ